jgi:hypothetical protein
MSKKWYVPLLGRKGLAILPEDEVVGDALQEFDGKDEELGDTFGLFSKNCVLEIYNEVASTLC